MRMPVLFIGHGSPLNAVQDNSFTRDLESFGKNLPRPESILMVSAHWMADGTYATQQEHPPQIYDFYGFPDELYSIRYTPSSSSALALRCRDLLDGGSSFLSDAWGLDHGAWTVLMRLFPSADIPVVQLSLDMTKDGQYHYDCGRKLSALRNEGVLIIGSGNIVHNLRQISYDQYDPETAEWAERMDGMIAEDLSLYRHERLVSYRESYDDLMKKAHPSLDHYFPLLYAAGAAGTDPVSYFHQSFQHSSLSMRCVQFG